MREHCALEAESTDYQGKAMDLMHHLAFTTNRSKPLNWATPCRS